MSIKIPLLVGMVVSTASLVTLGTFTVKSSFQNNSKIKEYSKWRYQFYKEKLYDKTLMCESPDINECSKEENKEYLPSPTENTLWQKAYESLESNRQKDKEKKALVMVVQKMNNYLVLKALRV